MYITKFDMLSSTNIFGRECNKVCVFNTISRSPIQQASDAMKLRSLPLNDGGLSNTVTMFAVRPRPLEDFCILDN